LLGADCLFLNLDSLSNLSRLAVDVGISGNFYRLFSVVRVPLVSLRALCG